MFIIENLNIIEKWKMGEYPHHIHIYYNLFLKFKLYMPLFLHQ